jgi:hypothetical protein
VPAQRQLGQPVEQHRQPVGRGHRLEERVEPGLDGEVAQQPLGERRIGLDPQLLEGTVDQRLGAVAQARGGRPRPGQDEHPLGRHAIRGERRDPARDGLRATRPGGADEKQRPAAMLDRPPLRVGGLGRRAVRGHLAKR